MHLRQQQTTDSSSQQISNKSVDTKKRIEKFKLCRYFEAKLNTLKRDLREQNKLHDESLSKMFNYILGEDPKDQTSSYDMSNSKRSFWLLKENKENISEDGDGNLLDLLSSSVTGDSLMSYYKKGQRSSNILNQSQNILNRRNETSLNSSVVEFLQQKKARMQKEKAIKFILRKLLEIYFENLLTFFKICGDPNFKYIRRSPKNESYSLRNPLEAIDSNREAPFNKVPFEQKQEINDFAACRENEVKIVEESHTEREMPKNERGEEEQKDEIKEKSQVKIVHSRQLSEISNTNPRNRPLASSIYLTEGTTHLLEEDGNTQQNKDFIREGSNHTSPNKGENFFSPKLVRKAHSRQPSQASMDKENIQEEMADPSKVKKKKKKPLGFYSTKKPNMRNQYDKENLSSTQAIMPQREPLALFQTNTSDFMQEYHENFSNIEKNELFSSIEKEYIEKEKKPHRLTIQKQVKKPVPKQRKERLFQDTEILWIFSTEPNDISPKDLIKLPRKFKPKHTHEAKKFNVTLEENALDEILKNAKAWNQQESHLNKSRKSFLPSPLKEKQRPSSISSLNVTLNKDPTRTEKVLNKSMHESLLVSKLKELQEEILFSPATSRRETEENGLQEKILMLTQRIKSVRISPARNKRKGELSPSEKQMTSLEASLNQTQQVNTFQDIPKKFVSSMELDLKDSQVSEKDFETKTEELETNMNNVPVQEKRKPKFFPFVVKLRIMTRWVNFIYRLTYLEDAFNTIREVANDVKEEEERLEEEKRQEELREEKRRQEELQKAKEEEEFKRPSKDERHNVIFASFSHVFPEAEQIRTPEKLNDENEASSPEFTARKKSLIISRYTEQITPSTFQGVLSLERTFSRELRKYYRVFFDNLREINIEEEMEERYVTEASDTERERGFECPIISVEEQMDSMVRMASVEEENYFEKGQFIEEYEAEEHEFVRPQMTPNKNEGNRQDNAINFREGEQENEEEQIGSYSNISSLTEEEQKQETERSNNEEQENDMQIGIMNTDVEFKKLLDYVLKNPQLRDELKASINFSSTAPVQEEEDLNVQQDWKQTLSQTLESTLEKKLEVKLQQLLEEKFANRGYENDNKVSRELQTMDFYPEIHLTKTVSPSRIHSSRKDYTGPCFTNLTTPRPAQSTYVITDLKASCCEWQENEMDGSMQKFHPLNDNSVRQEEEMIRQYEGWKSKRNTLDDVLYIYESIQKENGEEMKGNFEGNLLENHHKPNDATLRHRYPDDQTLSEGDNEILRELEFPTHNSTKKSIYLAPRRLPSILSRDVHFFYILDHIIHSKNMDLLAHAFAKMRGSQPMISMCLSSGSQSGFYPNDLMYSRSSRIANEMSREYEQKSRFLSLSQARLTKSYSKLQNTSNSDVFPPSVSITIAKSHFFRGFLKLISCFERKQLQISFENIKEIGFRSSGMLYGLGSTGAFSDHERMSAVMQNIFWLMNIFQRNQWKNLKWGFSNLLEANKSRDNTLKCLVIVGKIEDLLKKFKRQSFTKIYYDQTKREKMIITRRSASLTKISHFIKTNMKKEGFAALFQYAYRMASIHHRLDRLSYMLENRNMALLWHCFRKVRRFAHVKKEQTLYVVKLSEVLKEIQKSKMKSLFFMLKKKSHSLFMRKLEKRAALKKVLDKKMFRDYLEVKNVFWKWKSMSLFQTTKRFSRSFRDIQPSKEKVYLANFLNKFFSRKLIEEKQKSFIEIKEYSQRVKGIETLHRVLTDITLSRLDDVITIFKKYDEEIQNKERQVEKMNSIYNIIQDKKRRVLKSVFSRLQRSEVPQKRLEMNDKLMKLETVMANLKRNNLQKGMRMIELNFISRKNFESLCINLVLKTVFLIRNKQNMLEKAFFEKLAENYKQELQLKKFLKGVIARKHIKSLSYFFNKFRTRLTVLKASKSALNLLTKNYSMGIEKLIKIRKNRMGTVFNKLKSLCLSRKGTIAAITSKGARMRSPQPVITFDITAEPVMSHQTKKEANHKAIEFAFRIDKLVSKMERKLQRYAFDRIDEGPEIVGNQRYYVAMNNIDKLLFKKKLIYFLHFKHATEDLEEEETPYSRMSWNSNFDPEYFKQREEKIERLRIKKYFTEWRLVYIKYVNRRNKLDCAFNKLFNFQKKSTLQSLRNAFSILKELLTPQKFQLTLVSHSSTTQNKPYTGPKQLESQRLSSRNSSSFNRDRSTPSPIPFSTSQAKAGLPKSSVSPMPDKRRDTYSIGPKGFEPNNRNSVSPVPSNRTGRRLSDRSPQMKENSFVRGSNQRSLNNSMSKSPLQNRKENRFLHEVPMYSITSKK